MPTRDTQPETRNPQVTRTLDLQELTTTEELEALRPEWRALWTRAENTSPFQAPEWLIPWWEEFGAGAELHVLSLRHQHRLTGLLPMMARTEGTETRRWILLGTGISDYLDGLFDPELARLAAQTALSWLMTQRQRWDVCEFEQLPKASPLLCAATPELCVAEAAEHEPCPVLRLPATVSELRRAVPPHQLANVRYYRSRAAREGPVRLERAETANFEEHFVALFDLHRARWSLRGQAGVLVDEAIQRFHRRSSAALLQLGVVRLYGLRVARRIVASLYGFTDRGRTCYYLGGFDPEFQRLSPGTLLIGHAIEEAIAAGAGEFDFLRGRESYKYLWGAEDRLTYRLRLGRPTLQTDTMIRPQTKAAQEGR